MNRRAFLAGSLTSALASAAAAARGPFHSGPGGPASPPVFSTRNADWQAAFDKALRILAGNVQMLPHYDRPVLIEGSEYAGIWQECGPHEARVYLPFRPDIARNNHRIFFSLQKPDGQLPCSNKRTGTGFGQLQMVVPIAATAWEVVAATGDSELLEAAYHACSEWDDWLMRYRNTRGTGLIEGFCNSDTGMDNSPRWAGIPMHCPGEDAKRCPSIPTLPRLCPDLSSTVYGARLALASMADALGRRGAADAWLERAETLRNLILRHMYVPEDAAFYDLDANNQFVRVRSVVLTRVCGEHVVDRKIFDAMWARQLGNPDAFWTPYPFPSVALNDPTFVSPIPANSWGGAAQALTALRAGRWMDHYDRSAEFAHLMERWCEALRRDMSFRQQIDPRTGQFTPGDLPNYSPASLLMVDFTWRLAGVREERDRLHWNVRPGSAVSDGAHFRSELRSSAAEIHYTARAARLGLAGRELAEIEGIARLETDLSGKPLSLLGIDLTPQKVELRLPGRAPQHFSLQPNQRIALT